MNIEISGGGCRAGGACALLAMMAAGLTGAAPLTESVLSGCTSAGTVRYLSACVYAGKEPKVAEIVADVSGLDEVSLVTWTGGDASACDYADWLEARFEGGVAPVYVSDLPLAFAWTFGGDQWLCLDFARAQVRKDRSVLDTGLSSGGQPFTKGLGVQAPSLIVVKVPSGAKRLVAKGRIDDVAATHVQGSQASAQFAVLAGLPAKGLTALLDLPQVLPPETRALIASLSGRCKPEIARDYEGLRKGQKLGNGGYLAPDVSYDGKQILFCYTDGALNDLDPCWLPNGRIAFISERRRGFGRCHPRPVPNCTLFSMFEDGTDIEHRSERTAPHLIGDGRSIPGKFVHHYGAAIEWEAFTPPYTVPGKFGAYASPLYAMLSKGHHEVKLTDEEMRRLVLFMESNASFFGHDHDPRGQAEGWIIYPVLQ